VVAICSTSHFHRFKTQASNIQPEAITTEDEEFVSCVCVYHIYLVDHSESDVLSVHVRLQGPSFTTCTRIGWPGWGQDQMDACGQWLGVSFMWTSTQKIIEPTEVILSSSHAKRLAFLLTRVSCSDVIKSEIFSTI